MTMVQTSRSSPSFLRDLSAHINKVVICDDAPPDNSDDPPPDNPDDAPPDNPDDPKKETIVDVEDGTTTHRNKVVMAMQNVKGKVRGKVKNKYGKARKKCQPHIERVTRKVPIIFAAISLILLNIDQDTDIWSSYKICSIQCQCLWVRRGSCQLATDSQLEYHPCVTAKGNHSSASDYCNNAKTVMECNSLDPWDPQGIRHLQFCLTSIGTILVSSIINSTYFLWILFPPVLKYIRQSDASQFFSIFIKFILLVLYILQLLPYAWLAMIFLMHLKPGRFKAMEGLIEEDIREKTTKRTKLIFIILEDTPQLLLNSMFVINSVIVIDNPQFSVGVNMLSIVSYFGIVSSCASISLALTLVKGAPSVKLKLIQFFTTFVSVGIRAFMMASYAATVDGFLPLTWNLFMAPVIVLGLAIVDYLLSVICICIGDFKQLKSFYEWLIHSDYSDYIEMLKKKVQPIVIWVVTLTFESDSVQCLIASFTYLALAVSINAASLSAWTTRRMHRSVTQIIFMVLQYLAYTSLLLNLLVIQWKGKEKLRCVLYSVIYFLYIGKIYKSVTNYTEVTKPFESFYEYYEYIATIYSTTEPVYAAKHLKYAVITAGIIAALNVLILIISLIQKCRGWISKKTLASSHGKEEIKL